MVSGGAFKTGPLYVSGKGVILEVQAGASLEAAFGPDDWPVTSGASLAASLDDSEHGIRPSCPCRMKGCCPTTSGHYVDFVVFESCHGCGLVGEGMLFGKGGRPPSGFDWYYVRTLAYRGSVLTLVQFSCRLQSVCTANPDAAFARVSSQTAV